MPIAVAGIGKAFIRPYPCDSERGMVHQRISRTARSLIQRLRGESRRVRGLLSRGHILDERSQEGVISALGGMQRRLGDGVPCLRGLFTRRVSGAIARTGKRFRACLRGGVGDVTLTTVSRRVGRRRVDLGEGVVPRLRMRRNKRRTKRVRTKVRVGVWNDACFEGKVNTIFFCKGEGRAS